MNTTDPIPPLPCGKIRRRLSYISAALAASVVLIFWGVKITAHSALTSPASAPGTTAITAQDSARKRAEFFESNIRPILAKESESNQKAIIRAKNRLEEIFQGYKNRVPSFAQALTGFRAKLRIAKAGLKDSLYGSHETQEIATQFFSDNVVSVQQMTTDVRQVLKDFGQDLEANRNQMLSEVSATAKIADFPVAEGEFSTERLQTFFEEELSAEVAKQAKSIPGNAMGSLLLSTVGGIATEQATKMLVTSLLAAVASDICATTVTAGGATAGGAVVGAAGGSVEPGPGTAIGLVAGFVVGWVIDEKMDAALKKKVTAQCDDLLTHMQSNLWNSPEHGLQTQFTAIVNETQTIHAQSLNTLITQTKS